jgi:hypothetical protein
MANPAQDPLNRRQPEVVQTPESSERPGPFVFHASPPTLDRRSPARQAYVLLRSTFIVLPIIVGVDKFFDVLVNWDTYLSPSINSAVATPTHPFMQIAGVIEVVIGFGIALQPRLMNLALAVASIAMGRLGAQVDQVPKRRLQALQ